MELMMQIKNQIEGRIPEIRRMSPADYSAMKEELIREARIAQAGAIRAAFARLNAAVVAFATRSHKGTTAMIRSSN